MKELFGGSETKSQATNTPVDMTPDEFKNLRGSFANTLLGLLQSGGKQYTGDTQPTLTGNANDLLAQLMGQTGAGTSRNQLLEDTIAGKFLPGAQGQNPFLDSAIQAAQRTTLQGLQETLDRVLPSRFTLAGQQVQPQSSSAFDRAAALATGQTANALGDIASNISYNAYNQERTNQNQAIALSQNEVNQSIQNLQAQALPTLIQQQGIENGLAAFQASTQTLLSILQTLAGVTAPTIANQQQSTSEGESQGGIIPGLTGLFKGK